MGDPRPVGTGIALAAAVLILGLVGAGLMAHADRADGGSGVKPRRTVTVAPPTDEPDPEDPRGDRTDYTKTKTDETVTSTSKTKKTDPTSTTTTWTQPPETEPAQ